MEIDSKSKTSFNISLNSHEMQLLKMVIDLSATMLKIYHEDAKEEYDKFFFSELIKISNEFLEKTKSIN